MTAWLARHLLNVACDTLPADRTVWGLAMRSELEEAIERGQGLTFALGCIMASLTERFARSPGRFAPARGVIALALIGPVTVFYLGCAWSAWRLLSLGDDPYLSALRRSDSDMTAAAAYLGSAPIFMGLLFLLASAHLCAGVQFAFGRMPPLILSLASATLLSMTTVILIHDVTSGWQGAVWQGVGVGVQAILASILLMSQSREGFVR